MPKLGDIKSARELGYTNNNYNYTYIECPDCHEKRWVALIGGNPRRDRCLKCARNLSKTLNGELRKPIDKTIPPKLGETRHGYDLDKNDGFRANQKYIYTKCPECDVERWVCFAPYLTAYSMCNKCSHKKQRGKNSGQWKGGKTKHTEGYIEIKLQPDDFFYPMCSVSGYVSEHRLIVAKSLKRCLLKWEVVHHINGDRTDNRIENLELLPHRKYHIVDTLTKSTIKILGNRIAYLENLLDKNNIKYKKPRTRAAIKTNNKNNTTNKQKQPSLNMQMI